MDGFYDFVIAYHTQKDWDTDSDPKISDPIGSCV